MTPSWGGIGISNADITMGRGRHVFQVNHQFRKQMTIEDNLRQFGLEIDSGLFT